MIRKFVTAVSFVYGIINLTIGAIIAIAIVPFKIANSMANDITKQLWK